MKPDLNCAGPEPELGLPLGRRRVSVAAVLAAMSLVVLDAGMVNIALPTMSRALHATPDDILLVITAYQTALIIALLPSAALGERLGNRRVFAGGVALFTAASVLCAISPSLPWLVAARFVQGLGGAAVMALGIALLRMAVSGKQLGAAIGWNALTVALASAASPALGAAILWGTNWHWLYLVNVPLGLAVLFASRSLPTTAPSIQRIDVTSIALNGASFALLLVGAQLMLAKPYAATLLIVTGLLTLWALVRRERPKTAPMIPLDLLADRSFRMAVIASVCCFTGQTAGMLALPFYLQHSLGQTPFMTGLYMTPWPLSVAATVVVTGRLSERFPSAWLCVIGAGALSLGMGAAALWPLTSSPHPLIACTILCGLGFGLFQVSNNRHMFLSASKARSAAAGGVQSTARLIGQTAGALLITLVLTTTSIGAATRIGLGLGAMLTLVAGLVSVMRSKVAEDQRAPVYRTGGVRK